MNINTDNTEWMARKACVGADVDPEAFFELGNTRESAERKAEAIATCGRCLVKNECLQYALTNKVEFGIWGGLDEQQRAALANPPTIHPRRTKPPTWSDRCGSYSGASRHRKLLEQFCDDCRDARNKYEGARKKRLRAERREAS